MSAFAHTTVMSSVNRTRTAVLIATLVLCVAQSRADRQGCSASISESDTIITFSGCISTSSASALIKTLRRTRIQKSLRFSSEGGDVAAAIAIANYVIDRSISIEFFGVCDSSCANYVLPVARKASVVAGTRILFHGDAETTLSWTDITGFNKFAQVQIHRIVALEEGLRRRSAAVDAIHSLQVVASTPKDRRVVVDFLGRRLTCSGLGLRQWSPTTELLTRFGIGVVGDLNITSSNTSPESSTGGVIKINPLQSCRADGAPDKPGLR